MSVITFHFTQFPLQRDSKSPAVGLGLGGTQIQVLQCFFNSKTGKLAEVPAVLIRASALESPVCNAVWSPQHEATQLGHCQGQSSPEEYK